MPGSREYILGVDPGLRACGWAMLTLGLEPVAMGVIATKPSSKKQKIRVADDDHRRATLIFERLYAQAHTEVCAVCCEVPTGGKGARAVKSLARIMGGLDVLVMMESVPLLQATPLEVKRAVTGKKQATKEAVREALRARFSDSMSQRIFDDYEREYPSGIWEHGYDAIGAVLACADSEALKMARRFAKARAS